MEYWDYPNNKTGLFASSEKNYYWCTENRYTYLCSKEESDQIDPWNDLLEYGWVISSYLRYDVIEHGKIIFSSHSTDTSALSYYGYLLNLEDKCVVLISNVEPQDSGVDVKEDVLNILNTFDASEYSD